jgi:hypothetical protein
LWYIIENPAARPRAWDFVVQVVNLRRIVNPPTLSDNKRLAVGICVPARTRFHPYP